MEQVEPTTKNLKNISKDVLNGLIARSEEIKTLSTNFKEHYHIKINKFTAEKTRLQAELSKETLQIEADTEIIKIMNKSLEKENLELAKLDSENQHLAEQIRIIESTNKNLLEKLIDVEEKEKYMKIKCKQLKDKKESNMKEMKIVNDLFKKYFGFDVIRLKEDSLKIVFNNLECECYVIFDFSQVESVIECYPQMNLEKINIAFREKKNFYDFAKYIRNLLKMNI